MSKPTLIVTHRFTEAVEARAGRDYDARPATEKRPVATADLAAIADGADAILATPVLRLDAATVESLPASVRIVANFAVGYDNIDTQAAKARGLVVTNTPEVVTSATAEIAMLCMLGAMRRAHEGARMLRTGEWSGWTPTHLLGHDLSDKRLGIVGMGRIGQATATRARAFGMAVHYHNRRRLPPEQEVGAVFHAELEEMLPQCDVLSLHCAHTPETEGLINAARIELLPAGAVVVNTARGPIVDDEALIAALRSGRLFAAGLDVFAGEPELDPRYVELDNAFLLPHMGTSTVETRDAMGFRALDNLDAFFAGREPQDRVA